MDIKVLEKNKESLRFTLKGSNPAYINTLRRLVMEEVPTMAIDEVEFIKNDSALYDEMLAHRLGLIILKTDLKSYNLKDGCTCKGKGCNHCELILKLKVKGPKTVYAEDLKSKDPKVKPVHDKTIIIKLAEGQLLELNAIARLGIGRDHVKFSPGIVSYQGYPEIKIKNASKASEAAKICPTNVFRVKNNKLVVQDLEKCILCGACEDMFPEDVEVKGSNEDFIVNVEPWGQLKAKEMIETAFKVMDSKLDDFSKGLKKLK